MHRYRIRFYNESGQSDRTFILWGDGDEHVLGLVQRLEHPHGVEIYNGADLLARLQGGTIANLN